MASKHLMRLDLIFKNENDTHVILEKTLARNNNDIVNDLIASGLKGRGGAGFPTGLKWKLTADEVASEKFVICNADEGEPGTFKDREILVRVVDKVLTGMVICGKVIGANCGYIYLRGEYKFLLPQIEVAIDAFQKLLQSIGHQFEIKVFTGCGAYICGEESALFESMQGGRGEPRNKPPFPTAKGFRNCPTVINNVETLAHAYSIFKYGAEKFRDLGVQDSRGSKVFSVSGDTPIPGIYELEFGMTLQRFVEDFGDGDAKAVQVGGASGFCVPRKKFERTIIGYQGKLTGTSLPTGGSMMIFNSSRSMYNVLHNYLEFFVEESCGQCTPCRIGTQQLLLGIEAIKRGDMPSSYLDKLLSLSESMRLSAKCGLGQSVGNSFSSIVENFREEMIY